MVAQDLSLQNLGFFDSISNMAKSAVQKVHNKLLDDKKNHKESPLDKLNDSWNRNVCDNFCQRVPHFPPNYVNSKCPEHCMEANPTFKKVPFVNVKDSND